MKKELDVTPPQVAPEELIALVTASFGPPEEHFGPSYSTRTNKDGPSGDAGELQSRTPAPICSNIQ